MAPRPPGPKKFKRGFEVLVFGNDPMPGIGTLGLREFSSTANNVITTIVQMFNEYEAQAPANPGCVPFYVCTGVKAIAGAYGTNYEPKFELRGWVARSKVPAFDEHIEKAPPQAATNGSVNGSGPPQDPRDFHEQYPLRSSHGRRDDMDDEIPF
jgi:hypothetical protein